jgi:hypothetical protein
MLKRITTPRPKARPSSPLNCIAALRESPVPSHTCSDMFAIFLQFSNIMGQEEALPSVLNVASVDIETYWVQAMLLLKHHV